MILPSPKLDVQRIDLLLEGHGLTVERCPVMVVAMRGYYRDSVGAVGVNDRDAYDDAIFLRTPDGLSSYRANTDPSPWGINPRTRKGYAMLVPGLYWYQPGIHKRGRPGEHPAFVQAGPVIVDRRLRPDDTPVLETGWFGINLHRGGPLRPGSEGCQTLSPTPWHTLHERLTAALAEHRQSRFPYVLVEQQG